MMNVKDKFLFQQYPFLGLVQICKAVTGSETSQMSNSMSVMVSSVCTEKLQIVELSF